MNNVIAKVDVILVEPSGKRTRACISVAKPFRKKQGLYGCVVTAERPYTIFGNDSFQALSLGLRFLADRLTAFFDRGGVILSTDGKMIPLRAYGAKSSQLHYKSLIKGSKRGNLRAIHDLAAGYATGDWPSGKDAIKAYRLYKRAAEKGHAESKYDMAWMLLNGEGVAKNFASAIQSFEESARRGHEEAAKVLADLFSKGLCGAPRDNAKAKYWKNFRHK